MIAGEDMGNPESIYIADENLNATTIVEKCDVPTRLNVQLSQNLAIKFPDMDHKELKTLGQTFRSQCLL